MRTPGLGKNSLWRGCGPYQAVLSILQALSYLINPHTQPMSQWHEEEKTQIAERASSKAPEPKPGLQSGFRDWALSIRPPLKKKKGVFREFSSQIIKKMMSPEA